MTIWDESIEAGGDLADYHTHYADFKYLVMLC